MISKTTIYVFLSALASLNLCHAYVSRLPIQPHFNPTRRSFTPRPLNYIDENLPGVQELPSLDQVTSDSFTDQTYHASTIVNELVASLERKPKLQDLVTAQLSHQDGIKGFFAVYLTFSAADVGVMPGPLSYAMKGVDVAKLVPVACMNVIRPIATATRHSDPILKENAKRTAHRAKKILASLQEHRQGKTNVKQNIQAVYAVAAGRVNEKTINSPLEEFWVAVFEDIGYDQEQRQAIAAAFAGFIIRQ